MYITKEQLLPLINLYVLEEICLLTLLQSPSIPATGAI